MLQGIAEAVYVNRVVLGNHPGPAFVKLFATKNHTKAFYWPCQLPQESSLILPGHEPSMDDQRLCRKELQRPFQS